MAKISATASKREHREKESFFLMSKEKFGMFGTPSKNTQWKKKRYINIKSSVILMTSIWIRWAKEMGPMRGTTEHTIKTDQRKSNNK